MEHQEMPGLSDFIAVARHGGLNAASRATKVPKATLSRRVRELEAALGTRLLERGGRQLRLTEEGAFLLARAGPVLSELHSIGEEVSGRGGGLRGLLRISAPSLFAKTRLGEIAALFVTRYPEVTLDIDIADSFVDLVRQGYDVVIRVNPALDTGLVGKCFLRTETVLAAPPQFPLPGPAGREVDAVLLAAQAGLTEWNATGARGEIRVVPRPILKCSSMIVVHEAARSGVGAALLPRWLIKEDLERGLLREWGVMPDREIEAWALHTSTRLASPKVRAFIETLTEAYRAG
jgi:DNA-binding transcriptional LysR family regulator